MMITLNAPAGIHSGRGVLFWYIQFATRNSSRPFRDDYFAPSGLQNLRSINVGRCPTLEDIAPTGLIEDWRIYQQHFKAS